MNFAALRTLRTGFRLCFNVTNLKESTTAQSMKSIMDVSDKLVWIDMEMTGLEPENHHILELACVVTDKYLNTIGDPLDLIFHQPENILAGMNDWSKEHHAQSGLTDKCRKSQLTVQDGEKLMMKLVSEHAGKCPLAGNTVYMDRRFLAKYMPTVDQMLHYRIVDVSTVKELCRRWAPDVYSKCPEKQFNHRALLDIQESIEELKYYQKNFLKIQ